MPSRRPTAPRRLLYALIVLLLAAGLAPFTAGAALAAREDGATVVSDPQRDAERAKAKKSKKPKVTLKLESPEAYTGSVAAMKVATKPKVKKAPVRIEAKGPGDRSWTTVGTGRTSKKGATGVTVDVPQRPGAWKVRAVVTPKKGKPKKATSKPRAWELRVEELIIADTVEQVPDAVAEDPQTAFDETTGDLTLPADPTLETVAVGDTLVLPPGDGFKTGLLRTVTAVETSASGVVTYRTRQATITEVFASIPADAARVKLEQYKTTISDLPSWVTCTNCQARRGARGQQAARPVEFEAGSFNLEFAHSIPVGSSSIDLAGHLDVAAVAGLDLDTDLTWSGVKIVDWSVEGGIEYDGALSATWEESAAFNPENERLDIGSIDGSWKGLIGPVPVWIDMTGTLFLEFTASGEVIISVEITSVGELKAGLQRGSDSAPEGFFTEPSGLEVTREIGAEGSARAALGVELAADVYSVGGPRITGGWQAQAEMSAAPPDEEGQPWISCSLTHGPLASLSLGLSDGLADFLEIENSSVDLWNSDFAQYPLFDCPTGTNPPEIETTELPDATPGTFYLAQLALTDDEDRDGTWTATGLPDGLTMQEGGSIVGTPANGSEGTYPVKVVFTDAKQRKDKATLELVVTAAASDEPATSISYTDPVGDAPYLDISRVEAESAGAQSPGGFLVTLAKNDTSVHAPSVFVYLDLDGDDLADYRVDTYTGGGVDGADVYRYPSSGPATWEKSMSRCLILSWPDRAGVVSLSFDDGCLAQETAKFGRKFSDFTDVRIIVFAGPTYEGGYSPGEEDWALDRDGDTYVWSERWAMIPEGATPDPDPDPDPGAQSSVEFADPEGDQTGDFNHQLDLTRVTARGASRTADGSIVLDFAYIVERGGSSRLHNLLDLDADGVADYIVDAGRRLGNVYRNVYRGTVNNSNLVPELAKCFNFSWPDPDFTATVTFNRACLASATAEDFSSVRLRVEARYALDGIAGTTVSDESPGEGAWSAPFAMVGR